MTQIECLHSYARCHLLYDDRIFQYIYKKRNVNFFFFYVISSTHVIVCLLSSTSVKMYQGQLPYLFFRLNTNSIQNKRMSFADFSVTPLDSQFVQTAQALFQVTPYQCVPSTHVSVQNPFFRLCTILSVNLQETLREKRNSHRPEKA